MKKTRSFGIRKQNGFKLLLLGGAIIAVVFSVIIINNSKVSREPKASAPSTGLNSSGKNVKVTVVTNIESDCKNLYPGKKYSSCEYGTCGVKGTAYPPFFIKTNIGQKCGTYTIYTNSFPWNLWDRTKITKNMYCCVSKD